jgi:polyhydroxybutyrate depolymerase
VRQRLVALLVAVLSLLTACGGDEEPSVAEPATTSTTVAYPASVEARPSAGCGTSTASPRERERLTLDVGGVERWYLLSVPAGHDGTTPMPLVVELHGLAEGAAIAAQMSEIDALGEREGFVSVFPNGSGQPVRWNESLDASPNEDLDFLDALLSSLSTSLCIDEARVYATGLSYGAIMSSTLACVRSDRFAAIAPVAGVRFPDGCAPARPVPVLSFHGTVDPILFFNGGVGDLGAALGGGTLELPSGEVDLEGPGYPAAVAAWAEANGCGAWSDERRSEHVIDRVYECDDDAETRFVIIEGGGHSWPDSDISRAIEGVVGPTTDEAHATEEIWAFFERHARA